MGKVPGRGKVVHVLTLFAVAAFLWVWDAGQCSWGAIEDARAEPGVEGPVPAADNADFPSSPRTEWVFDATEELEIGYKPSYPWGFWSCEECVPIAAGLAYVAVATVRSEGSRVIAINTARGRRAWGSPGFSGYCEFMPLVSEDVVIAGIGGRLRGFDARSGKHLWTWEGIGQLGPRPEVDSSTLFSNPLSEGEIDALDARTGEKLWHQRYGGGPTEPAGMLYVEGKVCYSSSEGRLYAVNAEDGSPAWTAETGTVTHRLVADTECIYVVSQETVSAVRLADGETRWKQVLEEPIFRAVVAPQALLVVCGCRSLHSLDKQTGEIQWSFDSEAGSWDRPSDLSAPAAVDGKVLVAAGENRLYCFDAKTGEALWSYRSAEPSPIDEKHKPRHPRSLPPYPLQFPFLTLGQTVYAALAESYTQFRVDISAGMVPEEKWKVENFGKAKLFAFDLTSGSVLATFECAAPQLPFSFRDVAVTPGPVLPVGLGPVVGFDAESGTALIATPRVTESRDFLHHGRLYGVSGFR